MPQAVRRRRSLPWPAFAVTPQPCACITKPCTHAQGQIRTRTHPATHSICTPLKPPAHCVRLHPPESCGKSMHGVRSGSARSRACTARCGSSAPCMQAELLAQAFGVQPGAEFLNRFMRQQVLSYLEGVYKLESAYLLMALRQQPQISPYDSVGVQTLLFAPSLICPARGTAPVGSTHSCPRLSAGC